jgi:hypothetical protein
MAPDFGLGFFVLEISRPGPGKGCSELSPSIRRARIDNAHRLDAWLRRLDAEQARGLAGFDAPPEFPLGRDNEVLIKRIGMGFDFHPLPPPVITESTADLAATTHMLCWSCGMYFSAAASSENDHGSMNLASKTAPLPRRDRRAWRLSTGGPNAAPAAGRP